MFKLLFSQFKMIHVYNRFAQILVYSFFICFSNAKESRSMPDEDIDNERRDQTNNVLLFLCNMVASFALSPFEISNRMMSLPFLLTAGIFGNLLVARFSYVLQSLSRCFIALSCCFLWTSWSLYIFDGKLNVY